MKFTGPLFSNVNSLILAKPLPKMQLLCNQPLNLRRGFLNIILLLMNKMTLSNKCDEIYQSLVENRLTVLRILEDAFGYQLPHSPQIIVASGDPNFNPIVGRDSIAPIGNVQSLASTDILSDLIFIHPDAIANRYADEEEEELKGSSLSIFAKELLTDIYGHRHKIIENSREETLENLTNLYRQYQKRMPNRFNKRQQILYILLPNIRFEAVGYLALDYLDDNDKHKEASFQGAITLYDRFENDLREVVEDMDKLSGASFGLAARAGRLLGVHLTRLGRNPKATQELFNRNPFDTKQADIDNFERALIDFKRIYLQGPNIYPLGN